MELVPVSKIQEIPKKHKNNFKLVSACLSNPALFSEHEKTHFDKITPIHQMFITQNTNRVPRGSPSFPTVDIDVEMMTIDNCDIESVLT